MHENHQLAVIRAGKDGIRKMKKYPDKIILGMGYPHVFSRKLNIGLTKNWGSISDDNFLTLNYPDVLWLPEVPKYRLVLEKVNKTRKTNILDSVHQPPANHCPKVRNNEIKI
jgi:hypothetical protein